MENIESIHTLLLKAGRNMLRESILETSQQTGKIFEAQQDNSHRAKQSLTELDSKQPVATTEIVESWNESVHTYIHARACMQKALTFYLSMRSQMCDMILEEAYAILGYTDR